MARQQLIGDIRTLDQLLVAQHQQLQASGQRHLDRLRQVPPLWLLAGGIVAGVVAGALGRWFDRSGVPAAAGLYSWSLGAMRLWTLSQSLQSGIFGPSGSEL